MAKHGITLGTVGANGKPDPMPPTLSSMTRADSPTRREKLLSMVSKYAARYSEVRAEMAAKQSAASKVLGIVSGSIKTMNALVEGAEKKRQQLEKAVADQRQTNASLRSQISSSQQTFAALRSERARRSGSGRDRAGPGLAERAARGEDVSKDVEKMYHDTFDRMAREHENCRGEFNGKDFKIECRDGGEKDSGGISGGGGVLP
jgi:hypothetical protein